MPTSADHIFQPAAAAHPVQVDIVYSPACPANAHFIGSVRTWLHPYLEAGQITLDEVRIDVAPERAASLLGVRSLCGLTSNVFISVFVNGCEVSKVPLHPSAVASGVRTALGLPPEPATEPEAWWGEVTHEDRSAALTDLVYLPLTEERFEKALTLCVCHHPSGGSLPEPYADMGRRMKTEWAKAVWPQAPAAGVIALDGERPAGLIEVYPRPIARGAGFVTGHLGSDEETLTVTCIEVAGGYPRLQLIDRLMERLLVILRSSGFAHRWVEGHGVYGWLTGTNPYWVFEKYGFARVAEIAPGRRVLMRREIAAPPSP